MADLEPPKAEVDRLTESNENLRLIANVNGDWNVKFMQEQRRAQDAIARAKVAALLEAAEWFDQDAARSRAERRVAGVRCVDCDLRYEERQQYSCAISGIAHFYPGDELAAAAQPDSESSPIGDILRDRAAAIEDES